MGQKINRKSKIWGIDRGPSGDVPLRPFVILSRVSVDSEAHIFHPFSKLLKRCFVHSGTIFEQNDLDDMAPEAEG